MSLTPFYSNGMKKTQSQEKGRDIWKHCGRLKTSKRRHRSSTTGGGRQFNKLSWRRSKPNTGSKQRKNAIKQRGFHPRSKVHVLQHWKFLLGNAHAQILIHQNIYWPNNRLNNERVQPWRNGTQWICELWYTMGNVRPGPVGYDCKLLTHTVPRITWVLLHTEQTRIVE